MSGGFFRGTSADQDTRFSNKQAKLLKSQKFAPELDHLVDMKKVNMEVMKPWITRRVTELLGFEDEVLINFIHGLLDAKKVNGKEVQIQITGFMEKNTGKFMRELWTLLLCAQMTASGVPQQFLDAKEVELRKKKVENDRITNEIQGKKDNEGRETTQERLKKMDGGFDAKDIDAASDPASKPRDSGVCIQDVKEIGKRNSVRASNRVSRSPHSLAVSTSPHRHRSRSISRSEARGRSLFSDRICHSPQRQSISPLRRHLPRRSPSPRRRSFHSRRRSGSRSHCRSPSHLRHRIHSPFRCRSPSLRRRRSPSPVRRRRLPYPVHWHQSLSPIQQQRSSLVRRRSPVRQISPSPVRRRSCSPGQSPSPVCQSYRSKSPRRRSPSPLRHRSAVSEDKRSPSHSAQRSPPSDEWTQSPVRHVTPSPVRRNSPRHQRSSMLSSRLRVRTHERLSPEARQFSSPLRSVTRAKDHSSLHYKSQDSISTPEKSLDRSISPKARIRTSSETISPYESLQSQRGEKLTDERTLSPSQKPRIQKPSDSPETREGEEETYYSRQSRDSKSNSSQKKSKYPSPVRKQKDSSAKFHSKDEFSPGRAAGHHLASESCGHYDNIDLSKKGQEVKSVKPSGRVDHPESFTQQKSPIHEESFSRKRPHESYAVDSKINSEKNISLSNHANNSYLRRKLETAKDSIGKVDHVNRSALYDSDYAGSGKHRREGKERRKHKRSEREAVSSGEDYSSGSELEDRKETKRRKKEERKLRKEEKHQRRKERRLRREERRAEKLKLKRKTDDYTSDDDEEIERMDSHRGDNGETLSEQKLEIELRNKALESLKSKRGMDH